MPSNEIPFCSKDQTIFIIIKPICFKAFYETAYKVMVI